ncbi:MAG: hypothetical protein LBN23_03835 [Paludibacter sp.]|jgi:hypothetical protein|nr:hypothetical protein [Paludibacter sp.]
MLKKTIIFLLDCLPVEWRDALFGIKRFRAKNRILPAPSIIFFTEKGKWHGGFADRMKGIVTLFHYCLVKNIEFKIYYTFPFELSNFLQPNEYDWIIRDSKSIIYNRSEAKFVSIIGDGTINRLTKLKTKKQIHAFANRDVVNLLNDYYKTSYTWGELFNMLFKPTDKLQAAIDEKLKIIDGKYICAVFRFQNMLGDFAEYQYKPLSEDKKEILIEKCKKAVSDLQKNENQRILVTSDSETFLKSLKNLPNVFSFPAKVVHIDNGENETYNVYMKSFLDFYLLSASEKIYSIGTAEMYKSEFPLYAAKVNNIAFERILV